MSRKISARLSDEAYERLNCLAVSTNKSMTAAMEDLILKGNVSITEAKSELLQRKAEVYDNFNWQALQLTKALKNMEESFSKLSSAYAKYEKNKDREEMACKIEWVHEVVEAVDDYVKYAIATAKMELK